MALFAKYIDAYILRTYFGINYYHPINNQKTRTEQTGIIIGIIHLIKCKANWRQRKLPYVEGFFMIIESINKAQLVGHVGGWLDEWSERVPVPVQANKSALLANIIQINK